MAFVNEKVGSSNLEVNKYTASLKSGVPFIEEWTIDREIECVLIQSWTARQDMYEGEFSLTGWLFYWKSEWITFTKQTDLGGKISDNCWESRTKIINLIIPDSISCHKQVILKDLRSALQTYGVAGAFDTKKYQFKLILDQSEV